MSAHAVIPIFVPHLGCPFKCAFCNQHTVTDAAAPDGDAVRTIVERALNVSHKTPPEIAFYGGSFTMIGKERMEELLFTAHAFVKRGEVSHIRISTRPDGVSEKMLLFLRGYGVRIIELGAQSLDDRVLKAVNRGHDSACVNRAAKRVKAMGFSLVLQFIPGLPESTHESDYMGFLKAIRLKPDGVRIYPAVVLRNTALYALYESGAYTPPDVEKASSAAADLIGVADAHGIPVLRVGLNPNEALSGGEAVAGAYHPAFGEIAYGKHYLSRVIARLSVRKIGRSTSIRIYVHPSRVSVMVGHKRANIIELSHIYPQTRISVCPCMIEKDGIVISTETEN